jgi:hypothetical protein
MTASSAVLGLVPLDICPKAPGNAEHYTNVIIGYVLWGVGILFVVGLIIAVGGIVAGRVFSMPHASKLGVISIVVVFIAAVAYLVLPGILKALMGSGCIG